MNSLFSRSSILWLFVLYAACTLSPRLTLAQENEDAKQLVRKGIDSQGGEKALRSVRNMKWEASGYRNEIEESERPEGPYITDFLTVSEVEDFVDQRLRRMTETSVFPLYKTVVTSVVADGIEMRARGGAFAVGTPEGVRLGRLRLALSPERVLLTALDSGDLRREPDCHLQGITQNVIAFSIAETPVRMFLNSYTHLPTAVEYSGPLTRFGFYAYLGDVTIRTYYSLWWLAKGGIHVPLQWTVEGNGMPDQTLVIRKLKINDPLNEDDFSIPVAIKQQFDPKAKPRDLDLAQLGDPAHPEFEIASGILFIPGAWNVTIVRQDDGLIVLEAPISSGYSARVIAEAQHRYPGMPIKAVITTSDSWPHLAGIREYVAQGVPIYALDLNEPILARLIASDRHASRDNLTRSPKAAKFELITNRTVVGGGSNRIEIMPIRGETSERQMMVYFPEQRLLYGSDPFQKSADGSYFYPQTVTELTDAVSRYHLEPKQFFMMHVPPTDWTELEPAVRASESKDSPDGML